MKVWDTIEVAESLNRNWTRELLRFEAACPPRPALRGPDGIVPAQNLGGKLVCILDVPACSRTRYEVVNADDLPPADAPPASELRVEEEEHAVRIATGAAAFRFPLGPAVQPPLLGMCAVSGAPFGASEFYGPRSIETYKAECVVRGPVVAVVCMTWTYDDGTRTTLTAEVAAGDTRVFWDLLVDGEARDSGWRMDLSGLGTLLIGNVARQSGPKNTWGIEPETKKYYNPRNKRTLGDPAVCGVGPVVHLSPWKDWWDDQAGVHWVFTDPAGAPLFTMSTCDPGSWVKPGRLGVRASWDGRLRKFMPVLRDAQGALRLEVNAVRGRRRWVMGPAGPVVGRTLDVARREVHDWPQTERSAHPILYLTSADIEACRVGVEDPRVQAYLADADKDLDTPYTDGSGPGNDTLQNRTNEKAMAAWLLTQSTEVAERMHLVERLRRRLSRVEQKESLDWMRYIPNVVHFYDIVMASDLISDAERTLFRAQMAHLGYLMADPRVWSMERGYCSGNPNMSVSYNLNLGMIACVIPEHPEAEHWIRRAVLMLRRFIAKHKGPKGEWTESMNYVHVSMNNIILFAMAARDAGFLDLFEEDDLQQIMTIAAKLHSPPERRGQPRPDHPITGDGVRYAGVRGLVPWGRAAITGQSVGHYGTLARAARESDPEFSRLMQWQYAQTGFNQATGNHNFEMYKDVYFDCTLPAEAPDWGSEGLRGGMLLRHGFNTPHEHFLLLDAAAPFTWPGERGGIMLYFNRGIPLMSRFSGGYDERAEPLISRVSKARPRRANESDPRLYGDQCELAMRTFSHLPAQDYGRLGGVIGAPFGSLQSLPPGLPAWPPLEREAVDGDVLHWERQLLHVMDPDPDGVCYLALRDTVVGAVPSEWKLWLLSQGIGTPAETADRDAFLAAAPGDRTCPPRRLEGDRYTAVGQFEMDMEIYIAAPTDTARHTLRYCRDYGTVKKALRGFVESHDLLHLQRAGDGAYFVLLVPRRPDEPVPEFETMGEGRVVRVTAPFGEDFVFLSDCPQQARCAGYGIEFAGTAGSVQRRGGRRALSLGAGGSAADGELGLRSEAAAGLELASDRLRVRLSPERRGVQSVGVRVPGRWTLVPGEADDVPTEVLPEPDGFCVRVFQNTHTVDFVRA